MVGGKLILAQVPDGGWAALVEGEVVDHGVVLGDDRGHLGHDAEL